MKTFATAGLLAAFLFTGTAMAADPILGKWRTNGGETARIASCGGGFCITLMTGKHKGKRIGRMNRNGSGYKGSITDPGNNKTYSGSARLAGRILKMTGCALMVFCRSQNWQKL